VQDVSHARRPDLAISGDRLVLAGVVAPSRTEVDRLLEAAGDDVVAGVVAEVLSRLAGIHDRVAARDWSAISSRLLVQLGYRAEIVRVFARDAGGWPPFIVALVLRVVAEGRRLDPVHLALWYDQARPFIQAEGERRADLHPAGSSAATLAAAMRSGDQGPHVEQAVNDLRRRVRLGGQSREEARRPVPLVEPMGQIVLTVAHEVDTSSPLRLMADALDGQLDHLPLAIARDLSNEMARLRPRARLISFDLELDLAGGDSPEAALRSRELEQAHGPALAAADEAERRGRLRTARRLRRKVHRALSGGKTSRRTPEVRRREKKF
jgi:hypothetical protein